MLSQKSTAEMSVVTLTYIYYKLPSLHKANHILELFMLCNTIEVPMANYKTKLAKVLVFMVPAL